MTRTATPTSARPAARPAARRGAMAIAVLALAAGGLSACGGSDASSAPDDVSKADFCDAYSSLLGEVAKAGTSDPSKAVAAIKDFADKLGDVGTPSDIPDEARKGFELSIDQVDKLPDDASAKDLQSVSDDMSAEDKKDTAAFGTYVQKTCPDAAKDAIPSS